MDGLGHGPRTCLASEPVQVKAKGVRIHGKFHDKDLWLLVVIVDMFELVDCIFLFKLFMFVDLCCWAVWKFVL